MSSDSVHVKNAVVVTFGENYRVFDPGEVLVRGGRVEYAGQGGGVADVPPDARVIDARGAVVTPGLVNAHMHLYSTFACGIPAAPSHDFKQILENLWWRLDRAMTLDDVRLSALVPAARCLRSGVTTIIDHHASYGCTRGSLDVVADAVRGLGLRACLCYEVSDRWGKHEAEAAIEENAAFIRGVRSSEDRDLAAMFGLHASFTLSDDTLRRCADLADGAGFHVHVAEDRADVVHAREAGFRGAVDRLQAFGVLGPDTIAAHCIHVDEVEIGALAETGTMAAVNPQSNMNNAVGTARVGEMLGRGCTVALGSDGMTADILEEARALVFSLRAKIGDPAIMFGEAAHALTVTNPAVASRVFGRDVGVLREGAAGDLVVWDYFPPTPITESNAAGHLLFGLPAARADTVVASGRVVVDGGALPGYDDKAISMEARRLAAALWERW